MSQFEEFITSDQPKQPKVKSHDNRQHVRLNLRKSKNENLALACDGVTVSLFQKEWWRTNSIGFANIKDIGFGGVGIITAIYLEKGQQVYIDINGYRMLIEVCRIQTINSKLNFLGARWLSTDEEKVFSMLNIIQPALL